MSASAAKAEVGSTGIVVVGTGRPFKGSLAGSVNTCLTGGAGYAGTQRLALTLEIAALTIGAGSAVVASIRARPTKASLTILGFRHVRAGAVMALIGRAGVAIVLALDAVGDFCVVALTGKAGVCSTGIVVAGA